MIGLAGHDDGPDPASAGAEVLSSAERLAVLRQVGLTAAADEGMERFARLVTRILSVPVALVSLVEADRQVFPGQVGLAEPWATSRQTPLSHSLCQHVIVDGRPLILPDARRDEQACASMAISDLGVVAYAGMPLTDGRGHVLGCLCAIDERPRAWSERELTDLADLAAACGAELRLRIVSQDAERARAEAEAARQAAEGSHEQVQAYAAQAQVALERSELMLRAAEDLADTSGLVEVRRRVRDLVIGDLKPAYVGLVLRDGQQLRRVPDPEITYVHERLRAVVPLDSALPSARAIRSGQLIVSHDRSTVETLHGQAQPAGHDAEVLQSAVYIPLPGARGVLGALILGWHAPHQIDVTERAVLTAIAGYTARAVERALHLDDRVSVARQMQQALLTDLPEVPGLELAGLYRPADAEELVGGDWYDAYPLAGRPGEPAGGPASLAITVGDITGHDLQAATVMGQVRSMLRQADYSDRRGPSRAVTAVELASAALGFEMSGTLVHGHLHPAAAGRWQLTWTNAGHPPLLLSHPDGRTEQLGEHDPLLWPGVSGLHRTDRLRTLAPGDTLLLFTDGLIERRGEDIDIAISQLAAALAAAPARQLLPDLLRQLADETVRTETDDIALLAVRVPRPAVSGLGR
jgi:serine phosphatase RsbU (regulator of sigma subunit)